MKPKIRSAYSPHSRTGFACQGETRTKQCFQKECDINFILAKYQKTGLIDHVSRFGGDYSDLTDNVDYHTALNITLDANDAFSSLPSSIRKRFNNSPEAFLDFVSDPNNASELISLGLAHNNNASSSDEAAAGLPAAADSDPSGGTT